MKKVKMEISGMHCASCASNVEKSLKKVSGVKTASVSLLLNRGIVEIEDHVREEELVNAIKRAGYKLGKILYE